MILSRISRLAGFCRYCPLVIAGWLAGCAGSGSLETRQYVLLLKVDGVVNQGAPLKIRLFDLTDNTAFMAADYSQLQDKSNKALAASLVETRDIFLLPEETTRRYCLLLPPAVRYLGLFAEYKDMTHQRWRVILPVGEPAAPSYWDKLLPGSAKGAMTGTLTVTPQGLRQNSESIAEMYTGLSQDGKHE